MDRGTTPLLRRNYETSRKMDCAWGHFGNLAAAIVAVCVVDPKYDLHYTVSAPEVKANTLEVVLEVHNSPLSRGKTVSLYIGDKDVTVQSCTGADGVSCRPSDGGLPDIWSWGVGPTFRWSIQVPLGASGKHGQRGMVQEEYCVFDGGQALLLPMEFYQDGFPQDEAVVRSLACRAQGAGGLDGPSCPLKSFRM